ncbi:DNA-packaging protein FI, partial [Escherichia coli]
LGREPDMSGSAADIAQRVAELEEELGDVDGTDSQASALTGQENNEVSAQPDTVTDTADLVTVVALVTLHTDALHATRDEAVAFVLPGTAFRVSAGVAAEMTERGLARMQ